MLGGKVARAFHMGSADHLVKPFSPAELAVEIQAVVLRRGLEPSPQREPSVTYVSGALPAGGAGPKCILTEPWVGYRMALGEMPNQDGV